MQSKSIGLRGSESSSRLQHHAALRNPVRRPMNRALNLKNRFDSVPPPLKATRNAHHLPSQAQLRWLPLIWVKYCYLGSKKKRASMLFSQNVHKWAKGNSTRIMKKAIRAPLKKKKTVSTHAIEQAPRNAMELKRRSVLFFFYKCRMLSATHTNSCIQTRCV